MWPWSDLISLSVSSTAKEVDTVQLQGLNVIVDRYCLACSHPSKMRVVMIMIMIMINLL